MRAYSIIGIFFVLISFTLPALAFASTAPVKSHYTRLFYYQNTADAKASFFAHASSIDIFAPQSYKLNTDGTLSGSIAPDLRAFAKKHKIKVMPLVTNGAFSIAASEALLDDPILQEKAITALLLEAKNFGYAGWQFDFEQIPANYRDKYSAFIARASIMFKAAGLISSVAVIAKVSDNPSDYKGTLWDDLVGAYDYDALASSVDFISVMSYDDPESTGPAVELNWLNRVLAYSLLHIPPAKLSLGLALYYWARDDATGKIVGVGGNKTIDKIFKKYKVTVTFDPLNKVPVLHYRAQGTTYSLYYENAKSMKEKIALVTGDHLYGFSAWSLGLEVPSIWTVVRE